MPPGRIIVPPGRRRTAAVNRDLLEMPVPQETMAKMAALVPMAPQAVLATMPRPERRSCRHRISARAPLPQATVVQKDSPDHPVKADPQAHLAAMEFSRHLVHPVLPDPPVQTASRVPKDLRVKLANRRPEPPVPKDHPAHPVQLVNLDPAESPAAMENQDRKARPGRRVIVVRLVPPETQAAKENRVTSATKVCRVLVPSARRLVWLQATKIKKETQHSALQKTM